MTTVKTEAVFTPGPWASFRDAYGDGLFIDTALGINSENGFVVAGNIFGVHREANALLIAAAPDLYEALVFAERILAEHEYDTDYALAALTKARGDA